MKRKSNLFVTICSFNTENLPLFTSDILRHSLSAVLFKYSYVIFNIQKYCLFSFLPPLGLDFIRVRKLKTYISVLSISIPPEKKHFCEGYIIICFGFDILWILNRRNISEKFLCCWGDTKVSWLIKQMKRNLWEEVKSHKKSSFIPFKS